jgi:putative endopeptidase
MIIPRIRLSVAAVVLFTSASALSAAEPGKISGIDKTLFSGSVSPGENFYVYSNEKWLESTKIPGDKSRYGAFTILADETREKVRSLIERAAEKDSKAGTAAQKVGDLYRAATDMKTRNQAAVLPLQSLLALIDSTETKPDITAAMGSLIRSGVPIPLIPSVGVDARDSEQYTVSLRQSGLTLPDRDYYLKDEPRYVELRAELKAYIAEMLSALDVADPVSAADSVYAIESKLAAFQWTKTENRDPEKTYNKRTAGEIAELAGGFPWAGFADAAGIAGRDAYIVRQPSFVEGYGELFATTDIEDWKDYLRFRVIDAYANYLSESLERQHFEFYSMAISGVTEQEELWKRGVNITSGALGELVGQLYVRKHFRPAEKKRMNELVENLKRSFKLRIETRDWMGKGTKKQALEKLSMFTTKIGYPDEWKDYSDLLIESDVLATNLIAASEFEFSDDLSKLDGPVDRGLWHMTPQTVNAYYNPTMNEIVFPAAILQPPFFNMAADDAVNYGAIGAVIGHELSHGFDDKGSKYDGQGNLRQWWTEKDRAEFERRAEGLVQQYSEFEPIEGNFVNGELTLGENIGDLGGLSVAYEAYRLSLDGEGAPVIAGLTGDQRFFLGWSQVWRMLYQERELLNRLITDPHSPPRYRVNGVVRNMDAWYDAFEVKPGSPMYLAPEDRVRIW